MRGKITILKKTKPNVCGGTDSYQVDDAPKKIRSTEMTLFDVSCVLYPPDYASGNPFNSCVSAFAAPAGEGWLMLLETGPGLGRRDGREIKWALVKDDPFPALVKIVNDRELAKNNGFHSQTHGLPENFGGSIDIRYASGEQIGISDNQGPVLSYEAGTEIIEAFRKAMAGGKIALPDPEALKAIRFEEKHGTEGYTKACLTIGENGAGVNDKESKYDGPKIYQSQKPVDAETVSKIKKTVADCGLFAWEHLPRVGYNVGNECRMTFVFKDGKEITVDNRRVLPGQISRGFFEIQLEITTKH